MHLLYIYLILSSRDRPRPPEPLGFFVVAACGDQGHKQPCTGSRTETTDLPNYVTKPGKSSLFPSMHRNQNFEFVFPFLCLLFLIFLLWDLSTLYFVIVVVNVCDLAVPKRKNKKLLCQQYFPLIFQFLDQPMLDYQSVL